MYTNDIVERANNLFSCNYNPQVEVQTKSEGMVPMSLWLKDLSPDEDRKLAILEPVERTIGKVRKITTGLKEIQFFSLLNWASHGF